jgi:hypothetical protein
MRARCRSTHGPVFQRRSPIWPEPECHDRARHWWCLCRRHDERSPCIWSTFVDPGFALVEVLNSRTSGARLVIDTPLDRTAERTRTGDHNDESMPTRPPRTEWMFSTHDR